MRNAWGRLPRDVRVLAVGGLLLSLAYAGLCIGLQAAGSPDAVRALRMYGITMAAGREAALFDALHNGMALPVAIAFSILDDVGTLLLALVVVSLLALGAKQVPFLDRVVLRLETQALRRRRWVRRWGLAGLAAFFFLPGFGSGILAASVLAVMSKMPLLRVAAVLSACSVVIDAAWAWALVVPAQRLPAGGWWDWLPFGIVAVVLALGALGILHDLRGDRPILLDLRLRPSPQHVQAMAHWGLRPEGGAADDGDGGLFAADLRQVAAAVGRPVSWSGIPGCAEMLVLEGMRPETARAMAEAGVRGLRDVATRRKLDLARAAGVEEGLAKAWHAQALAAVQDGQFGSGTAPH